MDSSSAKLKMREKLGYASGDLACNLVYQAISMFLLIFYVDVYGLSPIQTSILFVVARIWDAINDPIMGLIVDKTHTRWGKFRPYLLFGAIPFGIIGVLCFTTPDFNEVGKVIYAYVTYIGLGMIYTVVNVPFGALSSSMTQDSNERTSIAAMRTFFATTAGAIIAIGLPKMIAALGNGNEALGYQLSMIILSIFGIILLYVSFFSAKERYSNTDPNAPKITIKTTAQMIKSNRPLLIICLLFVVLFGNMTIAGSVGTLYFKYNLQRYDLFGLNAALGMILNMLIIPFVPMLAKRFEKKKLLMIALVINIIRPLSMIGDNIPVIFIGTVVGSIGAGILAGLIWGLVPDTIEYGEWKTGVRAEGAVYAATGFFFKLGMALGGLLPGFVMDWTGYVANATQTPLALFGIKLLIMGVPLILSIAMLLIMRFYELDTKTYSEIVEELNQRKKLQNVS
ncbi:MFS transporter [Vallitalea okinawensis]|uniref:MFS transporter n=1 Tax=Vallitalea okinawensis TaxID=2078660 RepID=UPI000CFD4311|nr:MFS transporter [Vallitalea okinawensis]